MGVKIFEQEIQQRAETSYNRWRRSFLRWLDLLAGGLALHRLHLRTDPEEMIDRDGYARIRSRTRDGLVVGGIGSDWYPNSRAYLLLNPAEDLFRWSYGEPALSFLKYAPQAWSETVYAPMKSRVTEIIVRENLSDGVVIRDLGRTRGMPAEEAAEFVAGRLSLDFRDGQARARAPFAQANPIGFGLGYTATNSY
ncbi:hypothetical protein Acor_54750 [Acrocarpospora corrugata]|uniref:Uncharacterized protein n=1 Tax=Acrocarpospora corrugata TaxID=35763 RepID=A0A5M3W529_9ACTN|nr:hypothetical protein [Acrocarpospora corrugata]GES03409.1 hypothetical protein Acor_54750 [Acrocarpospora corrugata]